MMPGVAHAVATPEEAGEEEEELQVHKAETPEAKAESKQKCSGRTNSPANKSHGAMDSKCVAREWTTVGVRQVW